MLLVHTMYRHNVNYIFCSLQDLEDSPKIPVRPVAQEVSRFAVQLPDS